MGLSRVRWRKCKFWQTARFVSVLQRTNQANITYKSAVSQLCLWDNDRLWAYCQG